MTVTGRYDTARNRNQQSSRAEQSRAEHGAIYRCRLGLGFGVTLRRRAGDRRAEEAAVPEFEVSRVTVAPAPVTTPVTTPETPTHGRAGPSTGCPLCSKINRFPLLTDLLKCPEFSNADILKNKYNEKKRKF